VLTSLSSRQAGILAALAEVASVRGMEGTSVALVVARAGVSTSSFYDEFSGLQECVRVLLDLGWELCGALVAGAFGREVDWREAARSALEELLILFDCEPALARIWFVDGLGAGSWAVEYRERHLASLQAKVGERCFAGESPLELALRSATMSSAIGVVTSHVATRSADPCITLLARLTGIVVAPFLTEDQTRRDVARAERRVNHVLSHTYPPARDPVLSGDGAGREAQQASVRSKRAEQVSQCLRYLAEAPGASNGEIARTIGMAHPSQISLLLGDLCKEGLVRKRSEGPGKRNAWRLTTRGTAEARRLR
jgi:AcrR family transcriptional regulator